MEPTDASFNRGEEGIGGPEGCEVGDSAALEMDYHEVVHVFHGIRHCVDFTHVVI